MFEKLWIQFKSSVTFYKKKKKRKEIKGSGILFEEFHWFVWDNTWNHTNEWLAFSLYHYEPEKVVFIIWFLMALEGNFCGLTIDGAWFERVQWSWIWKSPVQEFECQHVSKTKSIKNYSFGLLGTWPILKWSLVLWTNEVRNAWTVRVMVCEFGKNEWRYHFV